MISKNSLPKLSQIMQSGSNHVKGDRNKKKKIAGGGILMIEGRSKII
jgi:hypothetical protein